MENESTQAPAAAPEQSGAVQQSNAPQNNGGAGDNGTNTTPSPSSNGGTSTAADTTTAGFSAGQLAEMKKFFDNNGGFEAVKSKLSNPQKQPEPQSQRFEQLQQPAQQPDPEPRVPNGFRTPQEMNFNRYMNDLANSEKYSAIHEYMIKDNGKELFNDLKAFNIPVMDNAGNINVDGINRWLGVKLQTVPSQQTSATPDASAAPTVEYVQVGKDITNAQDAEAVLRQSAALKAQGLAPHPAHEAAAKFLKDAWSKKR